MGMGAECDKVRLCAPKRLPRRWKISLSTIQIHQMRARARVYVCVCLFF